VVNRAGLNGTNPVSTPLLEIGHYHSGQLLSRTQVSDVKAYLERQKMNAWHVFNNSPELTLNEAASESVYAAYTQSDVANAPHLLEIETQRHP